MIELLNIDCLEYMQTCKNNQFDLAIVDPPYDSENIKGGYAEGAGGGITKQKKYNKTIWQQKAPGQTYFDELKRISKNQIIWGGNYFIDKIKNNTAGWIYWDKKNGNVSFSDGELAYTSFNVALKSFSYCWASMRQENMRNKEIRIHPTQKPVDLYKWLLLNYAKDSKNIFDSHLGSGSIAVACHELGYNLVACEIDKQYYNDALNRFNDHKRQLKLF